MKNEMKTYIDLFSVLFITEDLGGKKKTTQEINWKIKFLKLLFFCKITQELPLNPKNQMYEERKYDISVYYVFKRKNIKISHKAYQKDTKKNVAPKQMKMLI
jgi:hypothetical protein